MEREEAIQVVRGLTETTYFDDRELEGLRTLIPELTESENERIRKGLIEVVSDIAGGWPFEKHRITKKEAVAYLEKQKERGPLTKEEERTLQDIILHIEDEGCPTKWKDLLHDIYNLPYTKQEEQKPAEWKPTEEQFNYLAKAIMTLGEEGDCKTAGVLSEIRKGLKCSFPDWKVSPDYPEKGCNVSLNGEVKKIQEWSEDFDKEVESVHKRYPEVSFAKLTRIAHHFAKWADKYKSTEWSEELAILEGYIISGDWSDAHKERALDILKSLRPSWKPSEGQMEALLWCTAHLGGADHRVLAELYEQLKKL